MNKKQIEQEWGKLKSKIIENKLKIDGPYPPDSVRRRELLLFAQVHLCNILDAKSKEDKWAKGFETEIYSKVLEIYYKGDKKCLIN